MITPARSSPSVHLARRVVSFFLPLLVIAALLKWTVLSSDSELSSGDRVFARTLERRRFDSFRAAGSAEGVEYIGVDVAPSHADCKTLGLASSSQPASLASCAAACRQRRGCSVLVFSSGDDSCELFQCVNPYAPVVAAEPGALVYRLRSPPNVVPVLPFDQKRLKLVADNQAATDKRCVRIDTFEENFKSMEECALFCSQYLGCNVVNKRPSKPICLLKSCPDPLHVVTGPFDGWKAYRLAPEARYPTLHPPLQLPADFVTYPPELSPMPRIIHQIYLGATNFTEEELWAINDVGFLHPGWAHWMWRDEDVTAENFERFGLLSDSSLPPEAKRHLMAIEILWRYGGVYIANDFKMLRSMEPLLSGTEPSLYVASSDPTQHVDMRVLASMPAHPAFRRCLDAVTGPLDADLLLGSPCLTKGIVVDRKLALLPALCIGRECTRKSTASFGAVPN